MIVSILQDQDRAPVVKALEKAEFELTQRDSMGAYYRQGNTTLFILRWARKDFKFNILE